MKIVLSFGLVATIKKKQKGHIKKQLHLLFTAVLQTIIKKCRHSKCPSTDKMLKKMWHINAQ